MNAHAHAVLGASLTLLTACGGGSDGGAPVMPPPATGEVPETLLEGTWESPCLAAAPPASARRYVLRLDENLFTFNDTTYGDTLCDEDNALREIDTRGTSNEPGFEDGRFVEDGIPIDLAVEGVILVPRQSLVATAYNDLMLCDAIAAEWVVGVSQEVSGCVDETGTLDVNTTAPRTDLNVFLVDDGGTPDVRADDRLRLGTIDSVTDPSERPTTVDEEVVFVRRPGTLARPL